MFAARRHQLQLGEPGGARQRGGEGGGRDTGPGEAGHHLRPPLRRRDDLLPRPHPAPVSPDDLPDPAGLLRSTVLALGQLSHQLHEGEYQPVVTG